MSSRAQRDQGGGGGGSNPLRIVLMLAVMVYAPVLASELIGINARDLNTFELDRDLFGSLAAAIPSGTVRIAESAVRTASDVAHYRRAGADAVLVGEALVTSDPVVTLTSFLEI